MSLVLVRKSSISVHGAMWLSFRLYEKGMNREIKSLSVFPNDSSTHWSEQTNDQQLKKCTGLNRLTLRLKKFGATTENLSNIEHIKVKVKVTLVQALRLCTGRTAHRGSRDMALTFLDHATRRGWGISLTPRLLFTPGKDAVPIAQEAGWAPGPVWTGAENLAPTGIRSPDRPARSQSLYRLRYPAHKHIKQLSYSYLYVTK